MQPFLIVKNTDLIFEIVLSIQTYLIALKQSIAEKRARVCRSRHFLPPSCPMMTFYGLRLCCYVYPVCTYVHVKGFNIGKQTKEGITVSAGAVVNIIIFLISHLN